MILISYPAGGYGNFIYYALTEFSDNTYKPDNDNFAFDHLGKSHKVKKYVKHYYKDPENYVIDLPDTDLECLILCDNGILNDSYGKIDKVFPDARKIRLIIDHDVRPVVFKNCIIKAKGADLIKESFNYVKSNWIDFSENYAVRENFTLLYHNWPFGWQRHDNCINVSIESLIISPISTLENLISVIGGKVINPVKLTNMCKEWLLANKEYIEIYFQWKEIKTALSENKFLDLSNIVNLHDQGYINYCIEKTFNVTIPVYDYRNWFSSTQDIRDMIKCLK